MPTGIAQNPFLYQPRWAALNPPGIDEGTKYLLEERDRELEDYLGSLSSGSSGTASALRRTTNQSFNSGSAIVVACTTTDYLNGMTTDGAGKLIVVTAGVWHLTCAVAFNVSGGSDPVAVALFGGTERVDSGNRPVVNGDSGFECLSMDVNLAVAAEVYCVVSETSGSGVATGTIIASATHPARLSAHLVG